VPLGGQIRDTERTGWDHGKKRVAAVESFDELTRFDNWFAPDDFASSTPTKLPAGFPQSTSHRLPSRHSSQSVPELNPSKS
jgi:hypothetical protein